VASLNEIINLINKYFNTQDSTKKKKLLSEITSKVQEYRREHPILQHKTSPPAQQTTTQSQSKTQTTSTQPKPATQAKPPASQSKPSSPPKPSSSSSPQNKVSVNEIASLVNKYFNTKDSAKRKKILKEVTSKVQEYRREHPELRNKISTAQPKPQPKEKPKEMPKEMYYYDGSLHPTPPSDPDKKYYVYRKKGDKYVYTGYFTTKRIEELSKKESEAWKKYNELIEKRKQLEMEGHWKDDEWWKVFKEQQKWKEKWKGYKRQVDELRVKAGIMSHMPGNALPTAPLHPPPPERGVLDYTSPVNTKNSSGKIYRNEGLKPGIYTPSGFISPSKSSPEIHKAVSQPKTTAVKGKLNKSKSNQPNVTSFISKNTPNAISFVNVESHPNANSFYNNSKPNANSFYKPSQADAGIVEKFVEGVRQSFQLVVDHILGKPQTRLGRETIIAQEIKDPFRVAEKKVKEAQHLGIAEETASKYEEKVTETLKLEEKSKNPVVEVSKGFVGTLALTPTGLARLTKSFVTHPVETTTAMVDQVVTEMQQNPPRFAGELAAMLLPIPAGKVLKPVTKPIGKIVKPITKKIPTPTIQEIVTGAKVEEYMTTGDLTPPKTETKVIRIEHGKGFTDIIAHDTGRAIRRVELETKKRVTLKKGEEITPLTPEKGITLAHVKEIEISRQPTSKTVAKREGLGIAELTFSPTQVEKAKAITEKGIEEVVLGKTPDISDMIMHTNVGKVPNVKAEIISKPIEKASELAEKIKEKTNLKTVTVNEKILKEASKSSEMIIEQPTNVRHFKQVGEEILPVYKAEKVRMQKIEFKPELTKELLQQSEKVKKVKGKAVKPEELVPEEKVIKPRIRDKIFGGEVKEVITKTEREQALERLKEPSYRRELAKTLRDIYIYGKEGKGKIVETVKKEAKEGVKEMEKKLATDYPVLKEETIFDILKKSTKKFEDIIKVSTSVGVGGTEDIKKSDKRFRDISQEIQDTITRAVGEIPSIKIEPSKQSIIKPSIIKPTITPTDTKLNIKEGTQTGEGTGTETGAGIDILIGGGTKPKTKTGTDSLIDLGSGEETKTETGGTVIPDIPIDIGGETKGGTKPKTKTETETIEEIKPKNKKETEITIPDILIDIGRETETGNIVIAREIVEEQTNTLTDTVFLEDITPQIEEITTPIVEPIVSPIVEPIVVPTQGIIPTPYPLPEYPPPPVIKPPPPPPTTKNGEDALGWEFALSVLEQAVKKNPIVDDPLSVEIDIDFDIDLFGGGKKRSKRRKRR